MTETTDIAQAVERLEILADRLDHADPTLATSLRTLVTSHAQQAAAIDRNAVIVERDKVDAERVAQAATIAEQAALIGEAKEVARRLSRSRDCGCRPCTGQCTSAEALLIEAQGMRDTAAALLTRLEGEGQ
jgi:hypothetical protein